MLFSPLSAGDFVIVDPLKKERRQRLEILALQRHHVRSLCRRMGTGRVVLLSLGCPTSLGISFAPVGLGEGRSGISGPEQLA